MTVHSIGTLLLAEPVMCLFFHSTTLQLYNSTWTLNCLLGHFTCKSYNSNQTTWTSLRNNLVSHQHTRWDLLTVQSIRIIIRATQRG